jgi:hypothetical protein
MTQPFAHMDITEVFCDVDDFCKVFADFATLLSF